MFPRITNHNYTMVDNLTWLSTKAPRNPDYASRAEIARGIYDRNHNQPRPRIVNALQSADIAVKFVDQSKHRQKYYFDRAEAYHRERYMTIRAPPVARLEPIARDQVSHLPPIGQNFGYPEKRCFDPSRGGITFIPRQGDGTTSDARVGDYGQPPPSETTNDANATKRETSVPDPRMFQLKNFR